MAAPPPQHSQLKRISTSLTALLSDHVIKVEQHEKLRRMKWCTRTGICPGFRCSVCGYAMKNLSTAVKCQESSCQNICYITCLHDEETFLRLHCSTVYVTRHCWSCSVSNSHSHSRWWCYTSLWSDWSSHISQSVLSDENIYEKRDAFLRF